MSNDWISAEHESPIKGGLYIVAIYNEPTKKWKIETDVYLAEFDEFIKDGRRGGKERVTHWQPMPEPPKED